MAKISEDFIVENGCLKSYIGNDADVIIPDTVVEIDEYAFDNCKNVISITIPESVLKINDYAFYCRNLTTVTLSNNIKEIGMDIFDGCIKLSTFIFPDGIS